MAFVLQKWNTSTETWDDLSEQAKKFNLDMHLDIFGVREIEYNGQTLILDDENTIENGDYIRYGTDGSVSNYQNMIKGISSEMSWPTNHYWIAGFGTPTFDVDTTVAGKMYFDSGAGAAREIELNLPNTLTEGRIYRVKVKLRLNTSGGTNAIRFGCGIGVGSDYYVEFTPTGTEADFEGTFEATDHPQGTDRLFIIYTLGDCTAIFEIDDVELYLESDPVHFSGHVSDLVHKLKVGKYEFDLLNEIADLKTKDIPRTLSGDNLRQRLNFAMPADYSLVEMDSIAEQLLDMNQSGFDSITYPGEHVVGTEDEVLGHISGNYQCFLDHVAVSDNRPTSGANWATYWNSGGSNGLAWQSGYSYKREPVFACIKTHESSLSNKPQTGASWATYWERYGSEGGTWEFSKQYNVRKFNDLLHDILLIANADTFGNNILYCVVVNKELRMYGVNINGTVVLISDQYIEECFEDLAEEIIEVEYFDNINDDLRGEGSMNWSNNAYEEFLVTIHKLKATTEKALMDLTGCARPGGGSAISGLLTGIEKDGSMFTYELTNLERVT